MPYRDAFTGLDGFRAVMERFPTLRVIVAHLGAFDTEAFCALTERFPHLYLDTTMVFTGLHPWEPRVGALIEHQDRIVYGSEIEDKILYNNAARLLGIQPPPRPRR